MDKTDLLVNLYSKINGRTFLKESKKDKHKSRSNGCIDRF